MCRISSLCSAFSLNPRQLSSSGCLSERSNVFALLAVGRDLSKLGVGSFTENPTLKDG